MSNETEVKPEVKEEVETPEVAEETKGEGEEAGKEEAEKIAELEKEKKEAETPKAMEKIQARIDALTAELHSLREENAELKTKKGGEGKKEYTKEQLYAILLDPERSANDKVWAEDQLIDLKVNEKLNTFSETQQVMNKRQTSTEKAMEAYPEMYNKDPNAPKSEIWRRAEEIYITQKLDKVDDGQFLAATLAMQEAGKLKSSEEKILSKKLDKEIAKKGLAAGGIPKKVGDSVPMDKLRKEGIAAGVGSIAWNKWQEAVMKKKNK
jgi:hypothetical protein